MALVLGFVLLALVAYSASVQAAGASDPDDTTVTTTRGNGFNINNPGNLRWILNPSSRWQGMIRSTVANPTASNPGYAVFDTLSNGVRALGKQLDKYVSSGQTTVTQIITAWAPPSENNTAAYIADVSSRLGVDPNASLPWPADKPDLVAAIIIHENGYNSITSHDLLSYLNS